VIGTALFLVAQVKMANAKKFAGIVAGIKLKAAEIAAAYAAGNNAAIPALIAAA
jgi:hypothetical protein